MDRHRGCPSGVGLVLLLVAAAVLLSPGLAAGAVVLREDAMIAIAASAPDVTLSSGSSGVTTWGGSLTSAHTSATMLRAGEIEILGIVRGVAGWRAHLTLLQASGFAGSDNVSLALVGAARETQIVLLAGSVAQVQGADVTLAPSGPDLSVQVSGHCAGTCTLSLLLVVRPTGASSPVLAFGYDLSVVSPRGPPPVSLGSAGAFAVLAKAGITTTGATMIVGDIGVSPIASGAMTGFGLVMDPSGRSSTSTMILGQAYAADYADPTPARLTQAILDLGSAVADATAAGGPSTTGLAGGVLGERTIEPGYYKWTTPVSLYADVVLSGGAQDTWIFQTSQTLDMGPGVKVILTDGAQAKNVFWQVAGQVTLGPDSRSKGSILGGTAIAMMAGAHLEGRAFAQTAVTLDANTIST